MTILGLQLSTHLLDELKAFYVDTLTLPLAEEREGSFAVEAGTSKLVFEVAEPDTRPSYYFGFHVSQNHFDSVTRRLSQRLLLHQPSGDGLGKSASRNAVFCSDPAQNVIALIPSAAPRDLQAVANQLEIDRVGELGLVVEDVQNMRQQLETRLGFTSYPMTSGTRVELRNATTTFILMPPGETILQNGGPKTAIYPIIMTLAGNINAVDRLDDYPYFIHIADISDVPGVQLATPV